MIKSIIIIVAFVLMCKSEDDYNNNHVNCHALTEDQNQNPNLESAKQLSNYFQIKLKFSSDYRKCWTRLSMNLYAITAFENVTIKQYKIKGYKELKSQEGVKLIPIPNNMDDNDIITFNIGYGDEERNPKLSYNIKYKFGVGKTFYGSDAITFHMFDQPYALKLPSENSNTTKLEVILIIVLVILLVITFILLGVLLFINYSGDKWQNLFIFWSKNDRVNLIGRENRNDIDQSYRCSTLSIGSFHEGNFEPKSHPISVSDLSDTIPLLIENGTLKQEFASVSRGQLRLWDYGKQVQHKSKNRYGNLLPYDHSRVVLECNAGDDTSDYINANYVDGYKCSNRYIATQGPLLDTINDMWRMIWQFNCHQIVMLTSLDEGGKNKCDKYWPDMSDQSMSYLNIKVSLKKTEIFADYILRTFLVEKEGVMREVIQYHFISWPDHTVPMYACSLLTFVRKMRSSQHYIATQPIVVHCSAGVGRTGTFILIDAMLEMAKHEKQIDILGHLCTIRLQRINLVEKWAQYVFVHQALLEALSHETTSIDCNNFPQYYSKLTSFDANSNTSPIVKQYQILNKLSPQVLSRELCNSAVAHSGMNRNQDIIPPDFARVIIPGNDDYINAVYVNGYKRRDAYIVTQLPLESSRFQFWQMVRSTSTKTIILLDDVVKDEDIYWPTMHNKQVRYNEGPIVIRFISEEHHSHVTVRSFQLENSDTCGTNNDAIVKQFHLRGWQSASSNTTANANRQQQTPNQIIELIEKVEAWHLTTNALSNIIVQCFDGNQASGVYCGTAFICDRIKEEQLVDVFLAVQTIRTTRPQFITDLEQYKLLHQIAICYLQHFDMYANFK